MEFNELSIDEQVIAKYKHDEKVMIQLFVQWCINHKVDPNKLYGLAYPEQQKNPTLQEVLKDMDGAEEMEIDNETMLDVLQLFGNFDLAFIVSEEIERISKSKNT